MAHRAEWLGGSPQGFLREFIKAFFRADPAASAKFWSLNVNAYLPWASLTPEFRPVRLASAPPNQADDPFSLKNDINPKKEHLLPDGDPMIGRGGFVRSSIVDEACRGRCRRDHSHQFTIDSAC